MTVHVLILTVLIYTFFFQFIYKLLNYLMNLVIDGVPLSIDKMDFNVTCVIGKSSSSCHGSQVIISEVISTTSDVTFFLLFQFCQELMCNIQVISQNHLSSVSLHCIVGEFYL